MARIWKRQNIDQNFIAILEINFLSTPGRFQGTFFHCYLCPKKIKSCQSPNIHFLSFLQMKILPRRIQKKETLLLLTSFLFKMWCRRWWWFWPSHSWTQFSQLFLFLCCWFLTQLQSWPKITINWSVTLLDSFCWSQPGLRTQKRAVQNSRQRTNGCLNISIWKLFFGIMSSFRTSKPAILKSQSNNFTKECLSLYSILAVNFRIRLTFWKFERGFPIP